MLDELGYTVHHFAHNSTTSLTSQSSLLAQGKSLLLQVKGKATTWHTPRPSSLKKKIRKTVLFEYASKPPQVKGTRLRVLKDWGVPAESNEIFPVAGLTEFSSTEFFATSAIPTVRSGPPLVEGVPAKKRKLNRESLHQLITQPHFFPSPTHVSSKPTEFRAFKKTSPIFISPYSSLPNFLTWDRCTWIVPIYGSLPWPESTSATLLDQGLGDPAGPSPEVNEIAWTPEAVLQLWGFLLDLRTAGHFGPLALSFQPASRNASELIRASTTLLTYPYIQTNTSNSCASTSPISISAVDHIRIYHDGPKCMGLRTILDAWKYKNQGRGIRLLLGAKLVLLDEKSRGIMIL